jgi:hypothetical protein
MIRRGGELEMKSHSADAVTQEAKMLARGTSLSNASNCPAIKPIDYDARMIEVVRRVHILSSLR